MSDANAEVQKIDADASVKGKEAQAGTWWAQAGHVAPKWCPFWSDATAEVPLNDAYAGVHVEKLVGGVLACPMDPSKSPEWNDADSEVHKFDANAGVM